MKSQEMIDTQSRPPELPRRPQEIRRQFTIEQHLIPAGYEKGGHQGERRLREGRHCHSQESNRGVVCKPQLTGDPGSHHGHRGRQVHLRVLECAYHSRDSVACFHGMIYCTRLNSTRTTSMLHKHLLLMTLKGEKSQHGHVLMAA